MYRPIKDHKGNHVNFIMLHLEHVEQMSISVFTHATKLFMCEAFSSDVVLISFHVSGAFEFDSNPSSVCYVMF